MRAKIWNAEAVHFCPEKIIHDLFRDSSIKTWNTLGENRSEETIMMLKKSISANIILKPMNESDLDPVVEIEQLSFPCPWSKGMFLSEFHKRPYSRSYIAEEKSSGKLVGYVLFSLIFEELHILNLAVHPACRRKGIGDSLISFVLGIGRDQQTAKVLLEVRVSNNPALALYQKFGFREVGIRRDYYFKPKENALLLQFDFEKDTVSTEVSRWPG